MADISLLCEQCSTVAAREDIRTAAPQYHHKIPIGEMVFPVSLVKFPPLKC